MHMVICYLNNVLNGMKGAGSVVVIVEGRQVSVRVHHRKASHGQIHEASSASNSTEIRSSVEWERYIVEGSD